jgi:phosphatidylglycerophosphate synthase
MEGIGTTAIIVPPRAGEWSIAAERVAGVPLLRRILVSAERAGVARVVICAGEAAARLQALVAEAPPRSEVSWVSGPDDRGILLPGQNGTAPYFVIRASTVLNAAALRDLKAAFRAGVTLLVPAGYGPDPPVALKIPTGEADRRSAETVQLSTDAVCLDLSTTSTTAALRALYRTLEKPTDSVTIRWSRRLLFPAARQLAKSRVTPNHVTIIGFVIGLGAIACLWQGDYLWTVAGAALFVVAFFADLLDGMLARLKLAESRWGGWMDYILDNLVHLGIFAAIVWAEYRDSPDGTVLILGALILGGTVLSAGIVAPYWMHPHTPAHPLLAQVMHRDFSLLVLVAAIADWLEWFLWAAAVGINLFWPATLYVLVRGAGRTPRTEGQ